MTTPTKIKCRDGERFVRLPVGDVIQRGDLYLDDDTHYHKMDNLGRLFGITCLGNEVKKEGYWFRKLNDTNNA